MDCSYEDTPDGVRVIRLAGRMDIEGNEQVALRFTTLASTAGSAVVVDLTALEFLSSLGIATLVTAAKNLKLRQRVLALFGARANVQGALDRTNIPTFIPTCTTFEEARGRATAPIGG